VSTAVEQIFLHTCTIQRVTTTQNSLNEIVETWADHIVDQRCRLVTITERVATPGASLQVLEDYRMMLPPYTDISRLDRISVVTFEDDTTDGPFNVEAVIPRRDRHRQRLLALDLEKIV
jgi:hypothetical protein